jgi:GNAT superfamily N-acetyltransferase
MRIANAGPQDAPVLSELAYEAKRSWGYPQSWMAAWKCVLTVSPEYLAAHSAFVAFEGERSVGFAVVQISGSRASLEHLWVRPEWKRRGVGRALFRYCEEAARVAGADEIEIESDPHAEEFHMRMGAVRIGELPADMEGAKRSLPLLSKRLR